VASVELFSGSTKLGNAAKQADGSWRAVFDARRYPNGSYPVQAKAKDPSGNQGTSATITVTVRN